MARGDFENSAEAMTYAPPASARHAAQVMLALGIVALLVAVVIGGFGIFAFAHSRDAGGDWGGLTSLIAMAAGALAFMCLLVALGFLTSQGFVRAGSPRAFTAGMVVTVLVGTLPTAALCLLWAGNDPSLGQLCLDALGLAVWLAPHGWVIALLLTARREMRAENRSPSPS